MPAKPIEPPVGSTPHYQTENELSARLRLMRWLGHQEWAPRGTDRVLRALRHPESQQHFLFEVDFFGKRYRGDLAHYIDWLVFSYGAAPHCKLSLLAKATSYLRSKRTAPITFFDIGANVDHHTLFMSGVADQVIAFEPFPTVRQQLDDRLTLNKVRNVQVLPTGLEMRIRTCRTSPQPGSIPVSARLWSTTPRNTRPEAPCLCAAAIPC